MSSIHLVLLVLMVTSRVTIGSDVKQHQQKNQDETQHSQITIETNSISTSTETQGANTHMQHEVNSSAIKETDTGSNASQNTTKFSNKKYPSSPTTVGRGFRTTTYRTVRNGGSQPNRDNKLMNLLAARRSALQQNRFHSHRRTAASTNKTSIETPPKNSTDPRTSCERNCTKNFTRRTTASCMKRCVSLHNMTNNISSSTSSSLRTKVDEKDNNEILETNESSHGFFVVTKDLNDTVNHISDVVRILPTSTEKTYKMRSKLRSVEEVDLAPYVYFGQKLPPLKPTVLRITKTNDDHPKILEVSVANKSPDRSKMRNRYLQNRNIVAFHRKRGTISLTESTTTTTTTTITTTVVPEISSLKQRLEEKLIEEVADQDNSTVNILVRSTNDESTIAPIEKTTSTTVPNLDEFSHAETQNILEKSVQESTTLLINVPDPKEVEDIEEEQTGVYPPSLVTEDQNLIIFLNITTPKSILEEKSSTIVTPTTEEPSLATTPKSFTRTTVSSSVRSTVNPRTTSIISPLSSSDSSRTSTDSTNVNSNVTSTEFSNVFLNFSIAHKGPTITVSDNPDVNGIVLDNNDVTIEMHGINIATYVLAGLGMLPIVVIILYVGKTVVFKRRLKDDGDLDHYSSDGQPISPVRKMDHSDDERNDHYSIISDQDIDRSNLRFKSLLGEGNFGQVWKAEVDDLSGHLGTTRIVAVKTVRAGSSQAGLKEEAEIMRKLGSHQNVVTLLGTCIETEPHLLVMEYAMRGRLLSLLRAARSATNILPASVPGGRSLAPLSPRTLVGFALDIARGMEYISDKKIVHRDLAARNVLLDHNGACKICDFGMSIDLENIRKSQPLMRKSDIMRQANGFENRFRFDFGGRLINQWNSGNNNNNNNNVNNHEKKHHDSVSKRPALPIRWMAPEALQYHIFSTETDVWAFGIVLWEIATLGCTPYPNLSGREVVRSVPNGIRPELPQDGRPEFYDLMTRCWRKDPRQRPTFRETRIEISRSNCKWVDDDTAASDYMDVSGFSEDLEHGMVYFNRRISEFECEI